MWRYSIRSRSSWNSSRKAAKATEIDDFNNYHRQAKLVVRRAAPCWAVVAGGGRMTFLYTVLHCSRSHVLREESEVGVEVEGGGFGVA